MTVYGNPSKSMRPIQNRVSVPQIGVCSSEKRIRPVRVSDVAQIGPSGGFLPRAGLQAGSRHAECIRE